MLTSLPPRLGARFTQHMDARWEWFGAIKVMGLSSRTGTQRKRTVARSENWIWLRVHWGQNHAPENFHTLPPSPPLSPPSPQHESQGENIAFSSAREMQVCAKFYWIQRTGWPQLILELISTQSKTWSLRTSQKSALDRPLSVAIWLKYKKKFVGPGNPNHREKRSGSNFRIDWIRKVKHHEDSHLLFAPLLVDLFHYFPARRELIPAAFDAGFQRKMICLNQQNTSRRYRENIRQWVTSPIIFLNADAKLFGFHCGEFGGAP